MLEHHKKMKCTNCTNKVQYNVEYSLAWKRSIMTTYLLVVVKLGSKTTIMLHNATGTYIKQPISLAHHYLLHSSFKLTLTIFGQTRICKGRKSPPHPIKDQLSKKRTYLPFSLMPFYLIVFCKQKCVASFFASIMNSRKDYP